MKKTLYVSDLDGTLLNKNQEISDFTAKTINYLAEKGMMFSYATARSYITASKVTSGITAKIPVIVYNGTMIVENATGEIIQANFFEKEDSDYINSCFKQNNIHPIIFSYINGEEKFTYEQDKINNETKAFIATRKGDKRDNPIVEFAEISEVFHYSCIVDDDRLLALYEIFKDKYSCVYYKDIYTGYMWLEIMCKGVSKASAIKQLKTILGVDYIVAFGDGGNDLEMFKFADECYAVKNADKEIKAVATSIIESNDNDGVAKWLLDNFNV